ncbi:precorrin-6y C5,15-methyltransferase (decarboxylating) subunit CbiE [Nocardioides mangrovicus]|uniref:Precorrin-6y C5,15-methyltransferase (Decarboxylating) subunit CbiE n=1 Tax=Nocardioides mangrovicus TaxID=2478913 RepID=A0A3L8P5W5_9ACTN|nr:precorrin-6y C5,15-methyltransferase (decarboxylating) subunit CbiE [Nocardioides mangrovicus]RLV50372.1 precorrin-6y C5,15-methyltransferase (decarboxylating) subunit CbiE [Nocardioides mangrovicus]
MPEPLVTVVGIGAEGWSSVPEVAREAIVRADVLIGSSRQLGLLQEGGQVRVPWPSPLREGLPALLAEHAGRRVVALASGDPMLHGVGTTLVELLGADRVTVHPAVSSVALACARLGWSTDSTVVLRDHRTLPRELAPGRRILVLSADETTPAEVARILQDASAGDSVVTVLADLGSAGESRIAKTPHLRFSEWPEVPRLNVVAVEVGTTAQVWSFGAAGLPDAAYEHDGQLTKRDVRASALARLAPMPGQLLWDVGAGAGSVGIEWLRAHPSCRAVAVEADPERADRIGRNAARLGVPVLRVVTGTAPEALDGLPTPDAVFVGGGATREVVDACLGARRIVVHGVTLETERLLAELHAEHGGELTRLSVEHAAPLGSYTGWTPARTVTQWSLERSWER